MDEQKKAEGINEKRAAGDSHDGDDVSASSLVERADAAAERLAKENERLEANLRRQEELMAKKTLGGDTRLTMPEKPKEETNREFKDKVVRGEIRFPVR